jgi:hypothetical protein
MVRFVQLAGVLVLVAACSSDSGSGSGGGPGAAAAQCNAYVEKACDKLAPCQNSSVSLCVAQANDSIKQKFGDTCSGADQVGPGYAQCMTDLDSVTCAAPAVPSSCQSVVLFE